MTTTQNRKTQAAMTPEKALALLADGNRRFRKDQRAERDLLHQVEATSGGQWPFAAVLSCIDSRAPAELVFDQGIGDIFNVRIAGNCVNRDILGSLEFACKVAGARLVVVMGHTHCGAIKGACDDARLGHLTALLERLKPAVDATPEPADEAQRNSQNAAFVQAVAQRNVGFAIAEIRERSEVLRELERSGEIAIVGAMYDVETGAVRFE